MSFVTDLLTGDLLTTILGGLGALLALFLGWKGSGWMNRRKGRKEAREDQYATDLEAAREINRRAASAYGLPDEPTGKRDRD